MEKTDKRGGARKGAGRPKGDSQMVTFRAPGPMARRLAGMENRTEFIRKSIFRSFAQQDEALADKAQVIPARRLVRRTLPYFDARVTAGFPVPLDNDERSQDIDILAMLCPHPEASYLIRVVGDSMMDAGLLSGDIVIVDKSRRNPSPKEIAMCEYNGEYTMKHVVREGGKGWLVPANPAYPRFEITEGDDFSVWGTVTYIIHKARD